MRATGGSRANQRNRIVMVRSLPCVSAGSGEERDGELRLRTGPINEPSLDRSINHPLTPVPQYHAAGIERPQGLLKNGRRRWAW
jgi:hypothetical protein